MDGPFSIDAGVKPHTTYWLNTSSHRLYYILSVVVCES